MTPTLAAYLQLEGSMLLLDEVASDAADRIRDLMDPIWHSLSPDERKWLNRRDLASQPEAIRFELGDALFVQPQVPSRTAVPTGALLGWRIAA